MQNKIGKYLILLCITQSCATKPTKVCWIYIKRNNVIIHDNKKECYVEPNSES